MKNDASLQSQPDYELLVKTDEIFEVDEAERFFPRDLYKIINPVQEIKTNHKRFMKSSVNPGFQFEIRKSKVNFWVECKYRENTPNTDLINIFSGEQLKIYKSFRNSFLFLSAKKQGEQNYYFIPINHIPSESLNLSFIEPYRLNYGLAVRPGMINQYLRLENENFGVNY
jgi:hypothetical protein